MYVELGKKKLQILESFKLYQAKTEIKFENILKQGVRKLEQDTIKVLRLIISFPYVEVEAQVSFLTSTVVNLYFCFVQDCR